MKNLKKFVGKAVKSNNVIKGGKTRNNVEEGSSSGSTIAHETGHYFGL